jgi:hypothetical protein
VTANAILREFSTDNNKIANVASFEINALQRK